MRVKEWALREGLNPQTVWCWCRTGRMPVPFERTSTGVVLIHDPKYENVAPVDGTGRVVCYARVSVSDARGDLGRQADRLKAFALSMGFDRVETVVETGSGLDGRRRRINRVLADPDVRTLIVEHRDRLGWVNAELVESALKAQGRRLIVVDDTEPADGLERDMSGLLTRFCSILYGRRGARERARRMLEAAHE